MIILITPETMPIPIKIMYIESVFVPLDGSTCEKVFTSKQLIYAVNTYTVISPSVRERTVPSLNVHAAAPNVSKELRQHKIVRDRECNGRPPTTSEHMGSDYL